MKSRIVYGMAASLILGTSTLSPQGATAGGIFKENTNKYYTSDAPLTTSTYCTSAAPGLVDTTTTTIVEGSQKGELVIESPVMFTKKCRNTRLIETQVTSPVMVENGSIMPVVVEDRTVKAHHLFRIGIWPLFDFSIK